MGHPLWPLAALALVAISCRPPQLACSMCVTAKRATRRLAGAVADSPVAMYGQLARFITASVSLLRYAWAPALQ